MSTCAQCRAPIRVGVPTCPSCGAASGATIASDPLVGQVVGPYVLQAKLGEASYGAAYRAEQTAIGRRVTVRILHPWFSHDAEVVRRFEREARAVTRLQTPHLAAVHKYGRMADGTLYLATEHLEGVTLAECLAKDGRMEPARAIAIATQCLEALAEAHRHGVRHGALEPSKILLVPRGGPDFIKLLDVGISLLQSTHEDGRVGRRVPGTPQTMAPEQFTGESVDHRSDLYALGVVVYTMLAGRAPFEERTLQAYRQRHVHEPPPPLEHVSPGARVPPSVEACVMRALAKSPHHRPQSADAFADELWAALMATVERSDLPIPQPRRRRRRRSPVTLVASIGALAGALLGVGIGAYLFLRPTVSPSTPEPSPETDAGASEDALTPSELANRPLPELEAELRSSIVARDGARAAELTLQGYREAAAHPPELIDAPTFRRALLVRLLVAWRTRHDERPGGALPLDELEAVFLTMPSPLTIETRRTMLNALKQAARQDPDPRTTVRTQLVRWIEAYGKNDDLAREETQIEIVEGESGG